MPLPHYSQETETKSISWIKCEGGFFTHEDQCNGFGLAAGGVSASGCVAACLPEGSATSHLGGGLKFSCHSGVGLNWMLSSTSTGALTDLSDVVRSFCRLFHLDP